MDVAKIEHIQQEAAKGTKYWNMEESHQTTNKFTRE